MKLQDYRQAFYDYSGKCSDLTRQLAFAAIAVVWIFKKDQSGGGEEIPFPLILPSLLAILALALDMLQYIVASLIWRSHYVKLETEHVAEDAELQHNKWLEIPITTLFFAKVGAILATYFVLLKFLAHLFLK
jgi:hypothetical protein